jgi:uncharacterized protein (TIGR03066 family)
MRMLALRLFMVGLMVVVVGNLVQAGDAKKDPKELILGKWELKKDFKGKEFVTTIEFKKDGKGERSFFGKGIEISYKILSDTELEITAPGFKGGEAKTTKYTYKLTDTTLELTVPEKEKFKQVYTRVKKDL